MILTAKFKVGARVAVAPMGDYEADEIVGTIVEVLTEGYSGWYMVLLDKHLYGMIPEYEPKIEMHEDDLTILSH